MSTTSAVAVAPLPARRRFRLARSATRSRLLLEARRRAHPKHVRVGDRIDTWEVIGVDPGKRLTMRFGMKAPGAGELEFEVQPLTPKSTRLTATAFWHPKGVAGLAYWWAFAPAHLILFDGMTKEILRRAQQDAGCGAQPA
jgi:hypothetical protein